MVAIVIILALFFVISFYSEIHALGLWLALLIAHGFVVGLLGDSATHLPMFVGVIILVVNVGRGKWVGVRAEVWLLVSILVALMALAAILGEHPQHSIIELIRYSKGYILALFIAGVIREKSQVETVALYCVAAVCLGACIAIWQHLTGNYVIDNYGIQRAGGLSDDPNDTAMLLLLGNSDCNLLARRSKNESIQGAFSPEFSWLLLVPSCLRNQGVVPLRWLWSSR